MPLYYPKKGSAEAKEWARKMLRARKAKKIREAGMRTEREFFGPGAPLEVKRNPGAAWHKGEEDVAHRYRKQAKNSIEKSFFAGVETAHHMSGSAARRMGMNPKRKQSNLSHIRSRQPKDETTYIVTLNRRPYRRGLTPRQAFSLQRKLVGEGFPHVYIEEEKKNPIAIYNPPNVAGTIYNNAIEIRAQKTGGPLRGHYKHIFGRNVRILGLTDGTVLLQHKDGKPLWISRKDYERSGRRHD